MNKDTDKTKKNGNCKDTVEVVGAAAAGAGLVVVAEECIDAIDDSQHVEPAIDDLVDIIGVAVENNAVEVVSAEHLDEPLVIQQTQSHEDIDPVPVMYGGPVSNEWQGDIPCMYGGPIEDFEETEFEP